jgi:hypothetical protein
MSGSGTFSRRSFLGGSLAVGAAAVTTGLTPAAGNAAAIDGDRFTKDITSLDSFAHIGIRWKSNDGATLQVRWATPQGLSAWQDVTANHDLEADDGSRAALVVTASTTYVQVRVTTGTATDIVLSPISTQEPAIYAAAAAAAEDALHASSVGVPTVITRAQWGANESLRRDEPEFNVITKLIVHHSDTANGDTNPAATVRAIQAFHVQSNGWDDIGYNFLIDEQGRIYEGRWARAYADGEVHNGEATNGMGVVGAHALNANGGSVGVCLLGTFSNQPPTAAAIDALGRLFAWKASLHNIDAHGNSAFMFADGHVASFPNISGHRDTYSTSCPGGAAYALLPQLRDRVGSLAELHGITPTTGYWSAAKTGAVTAFGLAKSFGSMAGKPLNKPIVAMSATPSGNGYWLLGGDGGIFAFGDAQFYGSTGAMQLNQPVLALAPTPSAKGYWLAASDGGVFAYGDAGFYGSMGSIPLNQPVVGMASTNSGKGYWLVASDGGIFAFGDAQFYGSTGSIKLNQSIVGMAPHPSGQGYWLLAADGGIFAFGNAPFLGSVPGLHIYAYPGATAIASTPSGNGYWVLASNGSVNAFGDAQWVGDSVAPPGSMTGLDTLS